MVLLSCCIRTAGFPEEVGISTGMLTLTGGWIVVGWVSGAISPSVCLMVVSWIRLGWTAEKINHNQK